MAEGYIDGIQDKKAMSHKETGMTEKKFSQALRRGLGSAILELKNTGNNSKYRDIVLRCCLSCIAYDTQSEGTKGNYLYTAVKTFDDPEAFLDKIAEKFAKRVYWGLSDQLYHTLCCFADDGYKAADIALEKKYVELKNRLPLMRVYRYDLCEREQLENLMIRKLDSGFKSFKRCVNDIDEMVEKRGKTDCLWCDWFFDNARDKFGAKRVDRFIDEMYEKSGATRLLIDTLKAEEASRKEYQERFFAETVTFDMVLQNARDAAMNERHRGKMLRLRHSFAKKASDTELVELAHAVLGEANETIKALLLMMFWYRPFPLDVTPLIEYAQSKNAHLSEVSIERLAYIKDKRIHELAMRLLKEKGLDSPALGLLKKNYQKTDDDLLYNLIKQMTNVPCYVQQHIAKIYTHHRSANAFPILLHAYNKGECTLCRYNVVRAMKHCGVLPDVIIEECLFDSFEDTRRFAKRLTKG